MLAPCAAIAALAPSAERPLTVSTQAASLSAPGNSAPPPLSSSAVGLSTGGHGRRAATSQTTSPADQRSATASQSEAARDEALAGLGPSSWTGIDRAWKPEAAAPTRTVTNAPWNPAPPSTTTTTAPGPAVYGAPDFLPAVVPYGHNPRSVAWNVFSGDPDTPLRSGPDYRATFPASSPRPV